MKYIFCLGIWICFVMKDIYLILCFSIIFSIYLYIRFKKKFIVLLWFLCSFLTLFFFPSYHPAEKGTYEIIEIKNKYCIARNEDTKVVVYGLDQANFGDKYQLDEFENIYSLKNIHQFNFESYMNKNNISVGNSTLALLINLTSMQIITISLAFISLIFNYKYLNTILIICFIIGIGLNMSALALLVISIFSKRLSNWFIKFAIKIMKFFKVKNIEEKQDFLEKELEKYQKNAVYIKNNKMLMFKTIVTTLLQFIIYYSISYWTYRALGFNKYNIFEITTMQSVLFATVSGMPSPGAVGVSEGAFIEIFRNVYPQNIIKSATLLNRGINFYIFLIISGIVVMISEIKSKKENRKVSDK